MNRPSSASNRHSAPQWLLAALVLAGCNSNATDSSHPASQAIPEDPAPVTRPMANPNPQNSDAQQPTSKMDMMPMPSNPADIVFKDNVESNVEAPSQLEEVTFLDIDGKQVKLDTYLGRKNVVLVFTEGFSGMLCPFCKTQTSRLVANYDKFRARDTEVLVVYPGARDHLDEFVEAATKTEKAEVDAVPFPLVLDEDLKAVNYFRITSNLAHPSTFIINKQGDVQLAYVGADMTADRPSLSAMLSILDASANEIE